MLLEYPTAMHRAWLVQLTDSRTFWRPTSSPRVETTDHAVPSQASTRVSTSGSYGLLTGL